jgi:C_GCAxxG_C_C family probable redox protein
VLAGGEHLWEQVDEDLLRASSAFAGGIGCTYKEVCGALSGGILLIGVMHGRTTSDQNDDHCNLLAARYRERFAQEFGVTRCGDLRDLGYGSDAQKPCSALVERAMQLLLETLALED